MSIHQQITEACSQEMIVNLRIEPTHINVEFNALPDCHQHCRLRLGFRLHDASRTITVALIIETVEHYLSTNSVLFCQSLIRYCWSNRNSCHRRSLRLRGPLGAVYPSPLADMSDASLFSFARNAGLK